ncbi:WAT1-related protein At5g47470-like [Cornus florida]|uniref:WAT1-related protein At5g47470-like n=1 Tax=Cornus florida TaxID=4283 RepID=UPI0028A1D9DD|nr:WAT1-related protein At5g47470-like [Cornus florida]
MGGTSKSEVVVENIVIIGGLIGVQFIYAGNSVLLSYLMSLGLKPHSLIILTTFSTFLVLSPLCFYYERSKWPRQFTIKLWIQLVLISFGGVTMFQSLFVKGISLTSPAVATAMPNLAPGLIFLIAWTFRLERVKLACMYSRVKIVGTLVCVMGAITMSIMHSATDISAAKEAQLLDSIARDDTFDEEKIIGCVYLMAAVLMLSSNVVLQATTLGDFPAPMSLCAITSFIGVILIAILQWIQERRIETGWPILSVPQLIGYSLLGGMVNGTCVSFIGWVMKKRGPVFVSMFNPVATVISVLLSLFTLGQYISLGSISGIFLMFTGLYSVLWAKGKEGYSIADEGDFDSEGDVEKPLLN